MYKIKMKFLKSQWLLKNFNFFFKFGIKLYYGKPNMNWQDIISSLYLSNLVWLFMYLTAKLIF